ELNYMGIPRLVGMRPGMLDVMQVIGDPSLTLKQRALVSEAARALDKAKMMRFDEKSGNFYCTELGRIASHFYIHYSSVETYNEMLRRHMNDSEVIDMVAHSSEFENIVVREEEQNELEQMVRTSCPLEVKGGAANKHGKVSILIQMTSFMLDYCKVVDRQIWPHQHPSDNLTGICHQNLKNEVDLDHLYEMEEKILSSDSYAIGGRVFLSINCWLQYLGYFPSIQLSATVSPITRTVLKVDLLLTPDFIWKDRFHGTVQRWLILVEDSENDHIYHSEIFTLTKRMAKAEPQKISFTVPIFEPILLSITFVVVSDTWLTRNRAYEALYKFSHFNPIQTQTFHVLYHTGENVLLGAPTGSGKTISAELAMLHLFNTQPDMKDLYLPPLQAMDRERMNDWRKRLVSQLGKKMVGLMILDEIHLLGADRGPILEEHPKRVIVSRMRYISSQTERAVRFVGLSTALANAHDLADWLGVGEIGLFNFKPSVRPVPLEVHIQASGFVKSTTEAGKDVASEPGVKVCHGWQWKGRGMQHLWRGDGGGGGGRHKERVGCGVHRDYYNICYLSPLYRIPRKFYRPQMNSMNKPTYAAICTHSPTKPVLIFVSSRRQTRLTALDLIQFAASDELSRQFLSMPEEALQMILSQVTDQNLRHTLQFGIGLHHAGLNDKDRSLVEELFANNKIQVLVCTSTLAWGVNLPAHLVIIKGTEYYDAKARRYVDFPITDILQMMGRAGRPQYDQHGKAVILVHEPKKSFYKKFLYEPFPVESSLREQLHDHINAEIISGTICHKEDAVHYLTWTYLFRRLAVNPAYYGLEDTEPGTVSSYLSSLVQNTFEDLEDSGCVKMDEDSVEPTMLGSIASQYYLSYMTVSMFGSNIGQDTSLEVFLHVLSGASEYDELPVRHNEENFNEALSKKVPYMVDTNRLDDPHVKANLLFQAHFSQLELPISDYITDLKSVLDQSIRSYRP
ncbi:DExH-box ATP-dependent RNA helicase DExH14, partial [Camellia lanceoleosa]